MPFDQPALISLLRQPAYAGLSDADAATLASQPERSPKSVQVTYSTCAGAWGTAGAATFLEAIQQVKAGGGQMGAIADTIDTLLRGPGISPSNAEVGPLSQQFIAAGLVTQDQVDAVFYNLRFPAGGVVTVDDVTAARSALVAEDAAATHRQAAANMKTQAYLAISDWTTAVSNAGEDVNTPIPNVADLVTALQGG